MKPRAPRVLIVDDEPQVCRLLTDALSGLRLDCQSVGSVAEATPLLLRGDFDAAIVDMVLPDGAGLDLVEMIGRHGLRTRALCITGVASTASQRAVRRAGAIGLYEKPFDLFELVETVRRAVEAPAANAGEQPVTKGRKT